MNYIGEENWLLSVNDAYSNFQSMKKELTFEKGSPGWNTADRKIQFYNRSKNNWVWGTTHIQKDCKQIAEYIEQFGLKTSDFVNRKAAVEYAQSVIDMHPTLHVDFSSLKKQTNTCFSVKNTAFCLIKGRKGWNVYAAGEFDECFEETFATRFEAAQALFYAAKEFADKYDEYDYAADDFGL